MCTVANCNFALIFIQMKITLKVNIYVKKLRSKNNYILKCSHKYTNSAFLLHLNIYFCGTEMKIKMTAPVTSYVEPGSGPFSESTITISLYIPSEQQSDPPRPAESDVFIEDRAEMTVFVR